jgi:hypothetical protein
MQGAEEVTDFTAMDDPTLLAWRADARARLEHLPPLSPDAVQLKFTYDASTIEVDQRARAAWTRRS